MTHTTPAGHIMKVDDELAAIAGIRALLRLLGEDPDRPGLVETPARVVKAYRELCSRPGDPATDLGRMFPDAGDYTGTISVGPIPFTSVCEHHLLPFTGSAHIAYVPFGSVVGLSKIPRTVHHYAARPQVQERLTTQIADALTTHIHPTPLGVAVVVRGNHTCMSLRGACAPGVMETSDHRGVLTTDPHRTEFLNTITRTP